MFDSLRQLLRRTMPAPSRPVERQGIVARRRRRPVVAAVTGVAVVGIAGVALSLASASSSPVMPDPAPAATVDRSEPLPLPPLGGVAAEWLDDGTPVFVVHHPDGGVDVVAAEAPFDEMDAAGVAWCPAPELFVQVWWASVFTPDGSHRGGPAPRGLDTFEASIAGDAVLVGARRPGVPRPPTSTETPQVGASIEGCYGGSSGMRDLDFDEVLIHAGPHTDAITVDELRHAEDGTHMVRGLFVPRADGGVDLCDELAQRDPPVCRDPLTKPGQEVGREVSDGYDGWARVIMRQEAPVWISLTAMDRLAGWEEPVPDDRIRVEGEDGRVLTVPAFDTQYGRPLDEPIPAGPWRIQFVRHGELHHGLVIPDVVEISPTNAHISIIPPFELPPGDHLVYCPVPGHREAGMEFTLTVQ